MAEDRNPTLAAVIRRAIDSRMVDAHTAIPGKVVKYDAATQAVDVQPLIMVPDEDEDGEDAPRTLPVIQGVPFMFPGSGDWQLTWPVSAGDEVLLVFAEASIDFWLQSSSTNPVDPADPRRHCLADAVAIPGIRRFRSPKKNVATDRLVIGRATGARVRISAGEVAVDDGSGAVALAKKSDLDALKTYLDTHAHSGVTTGAGTSGPPNTSPTPAGTSVLKGK